MNYIARISHNRWNMSVNELLDTSTMTSIGEIIPGEHGGRPVLKSGDQIRIALPMAYVETCATRTEQDFLWRFFEAHDFVNGNTKVVDSDTGEPIGRYADHAGVVDAETYVKLEIQAYQWVRRYGLGREWGMVAEIFLRMMCDRAEISFIEWGQFLTESEDEKIGLGGGQASVRMLGLRLKDAYRDFFRWYRYVRECDAQGREPTGKDALYRLEREKQVAASIENFRTEYGLEK